MKSLNRDLALGVSMGRTDYSRRNFYKMFKDMDIKTGAEVGVSNGVNAVDMLEVFSSMKLYLVDPWSGDPKRSRRFYRRALMSTMRNLVPHEKRTVLLHMTSEEAAPKITELLDFVYIDGDHSYNSVMLDLILWSRKVRSGGIISGHDYIRSHKHGVRRAVNDFTRYNRHDLKVVDINWYWVVK